jgi:hypothetical protein
VYNRDRIVAGTESLFYMRHVDVRQKLADLISACHMWTNMSFHVQPVDRDRGSKLHMAETERAYGDALVWVCFPMSSGEKICGFWVMTNRGGLAIVAV